MDPATLATLQIMLLAESRSPDLPEDLLSSLLHRTIQPEAPLGALATAIAHALDGTSTEAHDRLQELDLVCRWARTIEPQPRDVPFSISHSGAALRSAATLAPLQTLREAPDPTAPWDERSWIWSSAKDIAEDIGHLGLLADPRGAHGPRDGFRRRLHATVDAFFGLGFLPTGSVVAPSDLFIALDGWADVFPVPDPARQFARALLWASVDHPVATFRILAAVPRLHSTELAGLSRALVLAPGGSCDLALCEALRSIEPSIVRIAASTLSERRAMPTAQAELLAYHPDSIVRASAITTLAHHATDTRWLVTLESHLDIEQDDTVLASALEALAIVHPRLARSRAELRLAAALDEPQLLSNVARTRLEQLLTSPQQGSPAAHAH